MGSFIVWLSTECRIIQWAGAQGRLRGELAGAGATSKCLEHNVCFLNHHPTDPPSSLAIGFKKITTGMLLEK